MLLCLYRRGLDPDLWVRLSVEVERLDARHMSVDLKESASLVGDGINPILSGSEVPLNQVASPACLIDRVKFPEGAREFTSNSAASFGETRSGEGEG
jgi:hypothetical protein